MLDYHLHSDEPAGNCPVDQWSLRSIYGKNRNIETSTLIYLREKNIEMSMLIYLWERREILKMGCVVGGMEYGRMGIVPPAEWVAVGDGRLVNQTTFLLQHLHNPLIRIL